MSTRQDQIFFHRKQVSLSLPKYFYMSFILHLDPQVITTHAYSQLSSYGPPCLASATAVNKGVIPYLRHGERYFFLAIWKSFCFFQSLDATALWPLAMVLNGPQKIHHINWHFTFPSDIYFQLAYNITLYHSCRPTLLVSLSISTQTHRLGKKMLFCHCNLLFGAVAVVGGQVASLFPPRPQDHRHTASTRWKRQCTLHCHHDNPFSRFLLKSPARTEFESSSDHVVTSTT